MRLTLTLIVVFIAGIAVGLVMDVGAAAQHRDDPRGFGFRLDAGTPQTVVQVIDGDTIELEDGLHVRLAGIDAPEVGRYVPEFQPCGQAAKAFLTNAIGDRKVRLEFTDDRIDRYGRLIAHVYLDAPAASSATGASAAPGTPGPGPATRAEQTDLSRELVSAGLARAFDPHGGGVDHELDPVHPDPTYAQMLALEQDARARHVGLWALARGMPQVERDANGRAWTYVAATKSDVFYRADAPQARAIPADKLIGFDTRDAALESGRQAAK
ncbi:MAG: thermonuclease family protein [Planctomycetota bacterium]